MWIAQDEDGVIYKYLLKPVKEFGCWYADLNNEECEFISNGKENPNWHKSRINLAEHDYEIIDGILTKKEKTMRHKHADFIHAWADGAEIEFKDFTGLWIETTEPSWRDETEYRIKPKTRKAYVRVFVSVNPDGGQYTSSCHGKECAESVESSSQFVRWVGDWIEVELNGH